MGIFCSESQPTCPTESTETTQVCEVLEFSRRGRSEEERCET